MIVSYDVAKIRQRELAEQAEQRRLEAHARRLRPAQPRDDKVDTTGARAA